MDKRKILFVSSEVMPYMPENEMSKTAFDLAKAINQISGQIRIFMPRFGVVNERRHQLHEVIRLSGMNQVINDNDMPLIIKVASIPKERMQVYFIDNDELFKRKYVYADADDKLFKDNDDRMIFFARGVVETVKKLNWVPDIIHVHGWMAAFLPMYIKTFFKAEPLFMNSKIIFSIYNNGFKGKLPKTLAKKLTFDGIPEEDIASLKNATYYDLIAKAVAYSDAIVVASESLDDKTKKIIEAADKPVMEYVAPEELKKEYTSFCQENLLDDEE